MADVIYTNAYLQPGIKSTLFWIFLVLSDSYMWMFLSCQWNVFSELCHRRNAIGGFHESKYKCFQMTMSCLQKRKKVKGCRNPFTPAVKKGKEFEAGCIHAYILLPRGTLQCRLAINISRMSPENHPRYTTLLLLSGTHSLRSIFGIHIVRRGGAVCLKRGVGWLKVGLRALWWPTAAEAEYQGDPKQACQGCCRNPLTLK